MCCVISGIESAIEFHMCHMVRWNVLAVMETNILGWRGSEIFHQFDKMFNLHALYLSQAMDSGYFYQARSQLFYHCYTAKNH